MRRQNTQRGSVLLIVMILLPVLSYAGILLAGRAGRDVQIASAGRRQMITYGIAEGAVSEVLGDDRVTLAAGRGGFAPDPGAARLDQPYAPITETEKVKYEASVRFLRQGPVLESSALEVRSLVYEVSAESTYREGGARTPVTVEFYRLAPVIPGHAPKHRHFH